MKTKILIVLSLCLLSIGSVNANYFDCCQSDCCNTWSAHGDWLYWNVRKCGLDYAWRETFEDPNDPLIPNEIGPGHPKSVSPDYDHGFRLGASAGCDWGIGVRYTYFKTNQTNSFFDEGLNWQASRVLPGTRNDSYSVTSYVESNFDYSKSVYDIELNVVDIEASKLFDENCGNSLRLFGGFRYASIDQSLKTVYGNQASITTDNTSVREKNDLDAYGLYIGAEGNYNLCGSFGVYGRFSTASLIGEFDRAFLQKNLGSGSPFLVAKVKDNSWCHVNNVEFAAGLTYDFCQFMCADWSLAIGYEFHTWYNINDFLNFCGTNNGIEGHPARQKDSLGFDGLFVRLGAGF